MDRTIYGRLDRLDALMERIVHLGNIECALPIRRDTVRGESGSMNLSLDPNALAGFIGNQPFDTIIRIVNQTSQNGKYDADTESRDPSAMDFGDDFQIWAIDLAGATFLNSLEPLYYGAWLCRDANGNPVSELGGQYYIAIANGFGHALTDTSWWLPVVGSITPAAWSSLTAYVPGNLVTSGGSTYLCIIANTNNVPPNADWLLLPSVTNLYGYDGQTTYTVGQYVQQLRQLYAFRSDCCATSSKTTDTVTLPALFSPVTIDTTSNSWISPLGTPVATFDFSLGGTNFVYGIAKPSTSTVTITNGGGATPGVITWNSHGLQANDGITFTTTGTLPAPFMTGITYYVIPLTANTFELSLTPSGPAINTSTPGSGTHTALSQTAITFTPTLYASGAPGAMLLDGSPIISQQSPLSTGLITTSNATLPAVGTSVLLRVPGFQALGATTANPPIVTVYDGTNLVQGFVTPNQNTNVAISHASPAVVTWIAHGLQAGDPITFAGSSLPSPIAAGTTYYVLPTGLTSNAFEFSLTPGGAPINTTTAGTGPFTVTSLTTGNFTPIKFEAGTVGNTLTAPALLNPTGGFYPYDVGTFTVSVSSGPYSIPISGYKVFANTTAGGFTVNLPAPLAGATATVVNTGISSNTLTINSQFGTGGLTAITTSTPGASLTFDSDGFGWIITSSTGTYAVNNTLTLATTVTGGNLTVASLVGIGTLTGIAVTYDGSSMALAGTAVSFGVSGTVSQYYFLTSTSNKNVVASWTGSVWSNVVLSNVELAGYTVLDKHASGSGGAATSGTTSATAGTAFNSDAAIAVLGTMLQISSVAWGGSPTFASIFADPGLPSLELADVLVPTAGTPVTAAATWTTSTSWGMFVGVYN